MNSRKFTLFLMGEKGLQSLKAVVEYRELIAVVVGAKDKNVEKDYYDEIREECKINGIAWIDKSDYAGVKTAYALSIAWRWLIPLQPENKLIILHDSLLPKYRGWAPLVNMLINHEPRIGVTALYANEVFDCGDIIAQDSEKVQYPIKIHEAIEIVSDVYVRLITHIFDVISKGGELSAKKQNNEDATYSLWRDEEDYRIDWTKDATYIQQWIYSLGFPYKGASTVIDHERYRVLDCELVPDVKIENRTPGKVIFIDGGMPVVVCGAGLLKITKLRNEGGSDGLPLKRYRSRFY